MERRRETPRDDWRARVEARGFPLHTAKGPYWDETGKLAPAIFIAALSIGVGLVNAACMEG